MTASSARHVLDLTHEKIKAIAAGDIYEMRVDDGIGGQDNIRIVLFHPPASATPRQTTFALRTF